MQGKPISRVTAATPRVMLSDWFAVALAIVPIFGCGRAGASADGSEAAALDGGAAGEDALDSHGMEADASAEPPPDLCLSPPDAACPALLPAPDSPCPIDGLHCPYPVVDDASTYSLAMCVQTSDGGPAWAKSIDRPSTCERSFTETVVDLPGPPCAGRPEIACNPGYCFTPHEKLQKQLTALVNDCGVFVELSQSLRVEFSAGCATRLLSTISFDKVDGSPELACILSGLEASRWACANGTACASTEGMSMGPR